MEKICWQITVAAFMQPLQYDLRDPAAKDNSITNAATARSNLDAAITMRSAETELQTAIPFTLRERSYSCKAEWNSIGNSSTSNTCNPICITGTILQLQITMEFHRQLIHQHHLQPHLQCGNDPTVANHNGILSTAHARKTVETPFTMRNRSEHDPNMIRPHTRPSRNRRTAEVDHRGSGTDFVWKNIGFRASALSKTHFVRDFLQNSIGNSSTSTTCNPIYNAGTILQLQITMEFCRPHMHENSWNPIYNAEPIRAWSEHDPTTHETVSQPSHRRGRSSRFGDGLCMEKHRVSCICYLSKTHFVRDFLQNSIGNSSTSTTCNAILTLSLTSSFPDSLKVTINSVPNKLFPSLTLSLTKSFPDELFP